jgi:hypothetical protein
MPIAIDQRAIAMDQRVQWTSVPTAAAAPIAPPVPVVEAAGANVPLPPSVQDDDDMGQEDARGFVYNAPALPEPPSFSGSTKAERRTFIRQYDKYLDQVNALQVNGSRPFVMPVSACMEVFTKKRVALWDMGNRDYREVTEEEWAAWFGKAYEEEPLDLDVLKKRLTTAIKFDTNILDADSRIGKMLDNLMRALERDDQAWVLDQEGKTVVDIMVKAVKPSGSAEPKALYTSSAAVSVASGSKNCKRFPVYSGIRSISPASRAGM